MKILPWYIELAKDAEINLFPGLLRGDVCCETIPAVVGIDEDNEAIAAAINCCCCWCVATSVVFCTNILLPSEFKTGTGVDMAAPETIPIFCESWLFGWLEMWAWGICTTKGIFGKVLETDKLLATVVFIDSPWLIDVATEMLWLFKTANQNERFV